MKNILIIDDDEIICRLIEKLSQNKDALVTVVKNGTDARNVLQSGKAFDVVFLDLVISDISGWDLLTLIRNDPATKGTPVVIVTGLSMSNEEMEKLQVRVSAIVPKKTFKIPEFENILNTMLQVRPASCNAC